MAEVAGSGVRSPLMGGGVAGGPPQTSPGRQLGGGGVGATADTRTIATITISAKTPPKIARSLGPDMAARALPRGGWDQ